MIGRAEIHRAVEIAVSDWRGSISVDPVTLHDGTKPVGGVVGFDSYSGVVATIQLEVEFGIELLTDNVFLSNDGKQARSSGEIVDSIIEILEGGK